MGEAIEMLLQDKTAVIYGGGGAIGGAAARAFAREGARVFLAGRTLATLERVANEIVTAGGRAETAEVDALNEGAVDEHADVVAASTGRIDIALNAIGIPHVQGTPFAALSAEDYAHPITAYTRTNFLTAKAVARHMVKQGSGVILTLSTSGSQLSGQGFLGYGVTCGAIETFSRILTGELGLAVSASSACGPMRFPKRSRHHMFASSSTASPSPQVRPSRTGWPNTRPRPSWHAFRRSPKSPTTRPSWRPTAPAR
jgi:NAD(P)-dependent dehydrogenase (short-subunit alcohol dehydrogenase family)